MNGWRKGWGIGLTVALLAASVPWHAGQAYLTPEERQGLDLTFKVKNPDESYFDVGARMELLSTTQDPMLKRVANGLEMRVSCREAKSQPVLDGKLILPSFYDNPDEWDLTVEPYLAAEQTMSELAGAWVATGDRYYADCLVDILEDWAEQDALADFDIDLSRPQAWYAVESIIFSAALAFSTVTGEIEIDPERRKKIGKWLSDVAVRHFNSPASNPSCCNNHYYRRSLYMTIVGVVTKNDTLFETGLRSVYSAIDDINEQGALQLAMRRGWRAIHYQNYSLLYLVTTMQVAYRQGYDLFDEKKNGRGFADAVAFLMRGLENPYAIEGLPPGEQDLSFTNDRQYFSWMEIWLTHHENPAMERFIRLYRPLFNRGAGGYVTLFFKEPESPRKIAKQDIRGLETVRMSAAEVGAQYPNLEKWRRSR